MTRRLLTWLALAAAACWPAPLPAQDDKPFEPTLVVRVKPVEGLLADLKYFAGLVNQANAAEQLDGVIGAWSPNGIAGSGIDVKRPFLAYAIAEAEAADSNFAVMIPVADEAAFHKLLEGLPVKFVKNDDGLYSVEFPNQPVRVFMRLANGYAYLSAMSRANLDRENLVNPDKLTAADRNEVLGVSLRIDRIPDMTKQLILGQVELRLADIKDRKNDGETPEQAMARRRGIDATSEALKRLLSEGKSLELAASVDRAGDDFGLALSLDGKPNTLTTTAISALAGGRSNFRPAPGSALHVGLNFAVPEAFRGLLGFAVDGVTRDAVAKESDPNKRQLVSKAVKAIAPTLKAGQVDLHVTAGASTANQFAVLAALGVRNGKAIEEVARELVATLPEKDREKIQLDAAKVGDVNLHKLPVEANALDANARRILGDSAGVWAGFRADALLVGVGSDPEATLSVATTGDGTKGTPLLVIEGSLARLAALDPQSAEVAKQIFGGIPGAGDGFRLSLEGGAKLKLALTFQGRALKFFSTLDERKKN